ncbi:MAG TPA: hypothetical protein VFK70_13415, partial [Vicinamibacteria bacterium]|nr:hypothetical protein [Vicinamibacteria bacterium]
MTRIAPPSGRLLTRERLAAAAVIAATVAALLWPVTFGQRVLVAGDFFKVWGPWSARWADGTLPHNTDLSDNVLYYLPSRAYAAASIREGRIPLWNPFILAGTPFLANGESGLFSPLNVLFLLFRPALALGYTAALQLFLAGFFFYLLMRELALGV